MKRYLATIVMAAALVVLLSINVFSASTAKSGQCGDNLTWEIKSEQGLNVLNISGFGEMYDEEPWYYYSSIIDKVVLPDGLLNIGDRAFYNFTDISKITIPESVTNIGNNAFADCRSLKSIIIPCSVERIGNSAFNGCKALTSIELKQGITAMGELAFAACESLEKIILPDSIESIGTYAFRGCVSLDRIDLPQSISTIQSGTFYNCTGLKYIKIPEHIETIGAYAFFSCNNLSSIYFYGDFPSAIEAKAFANVPSSAVLYYDEHKSGWATSGWLSPEGVLYKTIAFDSDTLCINHIWNDVKCTEHRYCFLCGFVEEKLRGHSVVVDEAVPATCESSGWTEGQYCGECYEILLESVYLWPLGHGDTDSDNLCDNCNEKIAVVVQPENQAITYHTKIENAWNSIPYDGSETIVTLVDNVTTSGLTVNKKQNVVLYGDGFSISDEDDCYTCINNEGTLVINSGTITCKGIAVDSTGTTTINGGTFISSGGDCVFNTGGLLTINGAETKIESNGNGVVNCGTLIVNDGTIIGSGNGCGILNAGEMMELHGGKICADIASCGKGVASYSGNMIIDGGTISGYMAIQTEYLSDGYLELSGCPQINGEAIGVQLTVGVKLVISDELLAEIPIYMSEYTDGYVVATNTDGYSIIEADAERFVPSDDSYHCVLEDNSVILRKKHIHNHASKVTLPTCTEQGYTTHTCNCGDIYVDNYVNATGHSYRTGICTTCGEIDSNYMGAVAYLYDDGSLRFYGSICDTQPEGLSILEIYTGWENTNYYYHPIIDCDYAPWYPRNNSITKVYFDETCKSIAPSSTEYWFAGLTKLEVIIGAENLNTSNVSDMEGMFSQCSSLTYVDTSTWDTSNVTDMHQMFYECAELKSINVTNWDTSNVKIMWYMFLGCKALEYIDVSSWNTDNVTNMWAMFRDCASLKEIDIRNWDVSNVTDTQTMFARCSMLETIYCNSDWSSIAMSDEMFEDCVNLVGGTGYAYTSSYVDATRAMPDSGNLQLGYFTAKHERELQHFTEVNATCLSSGNIEYWYCSGCDRYYTDINGAIEIELSSTIVAALNHDLIHHNEQAASCENIGWASYETCGRCDYTTYKEIPALEHDYIGEVTKSPTCKEKGIKTYTCQNDNTHTYTEEIDTIPHDFNSSIVKFQWNEDNTCVANVYCGNLCGETERHDCEVSSVTVEGVDCETKGTVTYTAKYLSYSDTKTVDGTVGNHKPSAAATCTNDQICTVCKTVLDAALGHTPKAAVEENRIEANCKDAGSYELVVYCQTCEDELERTKHDIPALGHTFSSKASDTLASKATCTEAETYFVQCDNCDGITKDKTVSVGEAKGHNFDKPFFSWSNDLSSASAVMVCSDCDQGVLRGSCELEWTSEVSKLTVTATVKLNGQEYTDNKVITMTVSNGKVIVYLPTAMPDVTIFGVGYASNHAMDICKTEKADKTVVELPVSGETIKLFFLDKDTYAPIMPCMIVK